MSIDATLGIIASLMIPADDARNLPSGSQVEVLKFLEIEDGYNDVSLEIEELSSYLVSKLGWVLEELTQDQFELLIKDHRKAIDPLLKMIGPVLLKAYYTNPSVQVQIGVGDKPPFPDGRAIYEGDLELLEPVFNRGPIFREV